MGFIYGLVRKSEPLKVRYVGRTKLSPEERFSQHKTASRGKSQAPVHRWMRKHNDTDFIVLEENIPLNQLVSRETYFIGKMAKEGHNLLNCTETGENGAIHLTFESRSKVSKSLRGNEKFMNSLKASKNEKRKKEKEAIQTVVSSREGKDKEHHLALLYARVSTSMQVQDGVSLEVQERALRQAAELAGYSNMELVREEGRSGKSISGRPALKTSLARLADGSADALFVTRLDRLSRSTQDFLSIIDHSQKYGWRLVLLDLNLDTSSYQSRFVVTIMSALAEMERSIISERQKDVHSDRRQRGKVWGKDIGPKKRIPQDVVDYIRKRYNEGESLHGIARELNAKGILSGYGKKWSASTIKYVLDRQ
jgi:DNA invertase Pin-like site-specific DNA recombinase